LVARFKDGRLGVDEVVAVKPGHYVVLSSGPLTDVQEFTEAYYVSWVVMEEVVVKARQCDWEDVEEVVWLVGEWAEVLCQEVQ